MYKWFRNAQQSLKRSFQLINHCHYLKDIIPDQEETDWLICCCTATQNVWQLSTATYWFWSIIAVSELLQFFRELPCNWWFWPPLQCHWKRAPKFWNLLLKRYQPRWQEPNDKEDAKKALNLSGVFPIESGWIRWECSTLWTMNAPCTTQNQSNLAESDGSF